MGTIRLPPNRLVEDFLAPPEGPSETAEASDQRSGFFHNGERRLDASHPCGPVARSLDLGSYEPALFELTEEGLDKEQKNIQKTEKHALERALEKQLKQFRKIHRYRQSSLSIAGERREVRKSAKARTHRRVVARVLHRAARVQILEYRSILSSFQLIDRVQ